MSKGTSAPETGAKDQPGRPGRRQIVWAGQVVYLEAELWFSLVNYLRCQQIAKCTKMLFVGNTN